MNIFLAITIAGGYFVNISLEPMYIELLSQLVCLRGIHYNGVGQEPSSDTIDKTNCYLWKLIPKNVLPTCWPLSILK
jgi:hypothetical protein